MSNPWEWSAEEVTEYVKFLQRHGYWWDGERGEDER